jgi:hypothetical protein
LLEKLASAEVDGIIPSNPLAFEAAALAICDHASSAELDLVPAPAFKITAIVIESRLPAIVIGTSD